MEKRAYIISLDLRNKTKDYSALFNKIKALGEWLHPQEPLWLVIVGDNDLSAEYIYAELRPLIENSDLMFVSEITGMDRQGWMPKNFWEKLKESAL